MTFAIVPAEGLWWLYATLSAAALAMLFGFHRAQVLAKSQSRARLTMKLRYLFLPAAALMLGANWVIYGQATASVEVTRTRIEIHAGLYSQNVPITDFNVPDGRIVDLATSTELQPSRRTNGTGAPGLMAGWFILRNGEKSFLLVTDRHNVVYLPGTSFSLLATLEHPDLFLETLHAANPG